MGRLARTAANQVANLKPQSGENGLGGGRSPWDTFRQNKGPLQSGTQLFSLTPEMIHPLQWHRSTRRQAFSRSEVGRLKSHMVEIWLAHQPHGRHLRLQAQTRHHSVTQQSRGNTCWKHRQRPTWSHRWTLQQQLGIGHSRCPACGSGRTCRRNPLLFCRSRRSQNQQHIWKHGLI
jgi:hypothetical protein